MLLRTVLTTNLWSKSRKEQVESYRFIKSIRLYSSAKVLDILEARGEQVCRKLRTAPDPNQWNTDYVNDHTKNKEAADWGFF